MKDKGLLVDSGPLVALLSERDQYHAICVEAAKHLHGPFYTSWPVITEAAHLLADHDTAVQKLLAWIRTSRIEVLDLNAADTDGIAAILTQYADQRFDFADAVMMHLANREDLGSIFTIDHRHFSVFRTSSRRSLSIVPSSLTR